MNDLEWEYNNALREGGDNIGELIGQQVDNLTKQSSEYKEAYAATQQNMAVIYASGATKSSNPQADFRDYVTMNEDGTYEVDQAAAQRDAEAGIIDFEEFSDWLDQLDETYKTMIEQEDAAKDAYNRLIELEQQTKEAYYELREMAKEAVLNQMQKQIDLQQDLLDATQDANDKLLNKIQEQINENRQNRQNEEAEKNIEQLRSRAAYLSMDTSGANQLAILDLNKEIEQAEQSYQDSLVDQSIQQLQDANEQAYEQRERQIRVAEDQLEIYEQSAEFQAHVDKLVEEALTSDGILNSTLGQMLNEQQTGGMSPQEKTDWINQLKTLNEQAQKYKDTKWFEAEATMKSNIATIAEKVSVKSTATDLKTSNQQKRLQNEGFSVLTQKEFQGSAGASYDGGGQGENTSTDAYEQYLDNIQYYHSLDKNLDNAEATYNELKATVSGSAKDKIQSKSDYYATNAEKIAKGDDVDTYSEYIEKQKNSWVAGDTEGLNKFTANDGVFQVDFYLWNGMKKTIDKSTDIDGYLGGYDAPEKQVGLGDEVTGIKKEKLETLLKKKGYYYSQAHAQGILYKGKAYIWHQGTIRELMAEKDYKLSGNYMKASNEYESSYHDDIVSAIRNQVKNKTPTYQFKTGGLANFTGPAWLDGTPSKPEYILNADQTEKFFALVDVLEGLSNDGKEKSSQGDNYFDISINVEKLDNDYDVEKVAEKIRKMIYEDATYRNVNSINHLR